MDLSKKKIVFTGVASGIGKETASELKRGRELKSSELILMKPEM